MNKKAIALVSGGLDSLLAARLVKEQGVEVQGVSFVMQFASRDVDGFREKVALAAEDADIPVKFVDISEDFLNVLGSPSHGYGANFNPCIDCKILMLKAARAMMSAEDASFVVTGEVLGERPMSQRRDALDIIKRDSALGGYLLRPLSARLMEETVPEKEGIVKRELLLDLCGRSRKRQFALAREYGITRYFAPAGGCLLTDPEFTRKLRDLAGKEGLDRTNVELLKFGRHFRLDDGTKVILGRDEKDNIEIEKLMKKGDLAVYMYDRPGPFALLRGNTSEDNIMSAARLVVSHSKYREDTGTEVTFSSGAGGTRGTVRVSSLDTAQIEKARV